MLGIINLNNIFLIKMNDKKIIIGLVGNKNAGKSTAQKHLCNKNFKPINFADKLKDIVAVTFNIDRKLLEGDTEESRKFRETVIDKYKLTPRVLFQKTADLLKQNFGDLFFIDIVNDFINNNDRIVVGDVRYPKEAQMLRNHGAILIKINRQIKNFDESMLHSSETSIDEIQVDYTIDNNSSIEDLYNNLDGIL